MKENEGGFIAKNREFIEETFDRITGTQLHRRASVRLLLNATENYPEWIDAIKSAKKQILFESYIIHDDEWGYKFADLFLEKVKEGIPVKLIYDWVGGFGKTKRKFWKRLREGGVEVRCFNPPSLTDPLSIISRDHRKLIAIDSEIGFVSGLCVGKDWAGDPKKNIPPWRDTGLEIRGAAVADIERAFTTVWNEIGSPLDEKYLSSYSDYEPAGNTSLRIVDTVPTSSHIFRMDQILVASVKERVWLTDAYFMGSPSYLRALRDAAEDGVDVRILVPGATDIPIIRDTTRTIYRNLLLSGARIFEWNGPMVHAKTAVFDNRFSRVGSTNLNVASWFGNHEIDVFVEDEDFALQMQEAYLHDLDNSTEIVLKDDEVKRVDGAKAKHYKTRGGSVRKATAGALTTAASLGNAITNKVELGPAEAKLFLLSGLVCLVLAALFFLIPKIIAIPLAIIFLILAFSAIFQSFTYYRKY